MKLDSTSALEGAHANSRSAFAFNISACVGKSAQELYSLVASDLGWSEQVADEDVCQQDIIYCVTQTMDLRERLCKLERGSWVTRYLCMPDLCDKGNFSRILSACSSICPTGTLDFYPRTWLLPEQSDLVINMLQKSKHTCIVKPKDGSQGDGIFLVQGLSDLTNNMARKSSKAAVVQHYIDNPLLLSGMKFDLRMYVSVMGGSPDCPPLVFLSREGLARFCTEKYVEPSPTSMHNSMAHLTNYSLNKESSKFEQYGETVEDVFDVQNRASKRPLTVVLKQLQNQYPHFDAEKFYKAVAHMVRMTIAAMTPAMISAHRAFAAEGEINSVQILGFDVMLDRDMRPYLLEVNNSPSLRIDELVPASTEDLGNLSFSQAVVEGAGTTAVNTTYTEGCLLGTYCTKSFYTNDRKFGLHCAKEFRGCPAGWYITGAKDYGLYYHPCVDHEHVPEKGWTTYTKAFSSPGFGPPPKVKMSSAGSLPHDRGKLCLCSQLDVPHYHKVSLIDQVVKRTVVANTFRCLQLLQAGSREPDVDSCLFVDVSRASIYPVLRTVETLFATCGGTQGAFSSALLQRMLAAACGIGQLQAEDIDLLSCQFQASSFESYDGRLEALRVFDFLNLLLRVAAATSPGEEPSNALEQLLKIIGATS